MKIFKPLLNSWKTSDILEVQVSKKIFGKSLPSGKCHHNIAYIQKKYGGNTVLGFLLHDFDDHYWCIPHSIWKNTNSEYIDVTLKDVSSILFMPVKTYDSTQSYYFIREEYRVYKDTSNGIDVTTKEFGVKKITLIEFTMESCNINFSKVFLFKYLFLFSHQVLFFFYLIS